jgi:thiamine-phosphate pyrophosphorylase
LEYVLSPDAPVLKKLSLPEMPLLPDCKLYTFVDTAYLNGRAPEDVAQQLCDGGSDILQLRAKQSSVFQIRAMAEKILPITSRAGVPLIINDYPDLVFELSTINYQPSTLLGCHLGQEDFFDAGHTSAAELKPKNSKQKNANVLLSTILGLSSHAPAQATRALAAGPDYIAIGPVYATGTKPSAKPVTLEYVRWAAQNVSIPWFAIGGINLKTLEDVLAAGARRVCVVSAILNAEDIAAECKKYKQRLA